jgi:hypothetical protein
LHLLSQADGRVLEAEVNGTVYVYREVPLAPGEGYRELEIEVAYHATPGRRSRGWNDPPEPAELEIEHAEADGEPVELTEAERERALVKASEDAADRSEAAADREHEYEPDFGL